MPHSRTENWHRASKATGLLITVLLSSKACRALNVSWSSPVAGDVYGPGAYILGEWNADTEINSPSFRLCAAVTDDTDPQDLDDACGGPVQTTVQQDSDAGSYQVILATPNVTQTSDFYLTLLDNAGDTSISPTFTLSPNAAAPQPVAPVAASASTPSSPVQAAPAPPFNLEQTRMPAPTAAYAIPLSIAGAVVLLAGGLGVHHHRALVRERAAEKARLARSAGPARLLHSRASSAQSDDEKAAAADDIYTRVYVPRQSSERGRQHSQHRAHTHAQPQPRPRETTREPYAATVTPTAHSTVTAGFFRATLSPRTPYSASPSPSRPTSGPPRLPEPPANTTESESENEKNASVYDSVVSHYLQPSPVPAFPVSPRGPAVPPKWATASPEGLAAAPGGLVPTPPRQAHVRKSASPSPSVHRTTDTTDSSLYDEVARKLSGRY